MNSIINEIMKELENIEYGFKDKNGFNIINDSKKWDNNFYQFYYLLTPEESIENNCGVCWDQVELERYLFKKNNIKTDTYFIYTHDDDNLPSHTFLTYFMDNKYYWFEHSWNTYKGIHEYNTIDDLLSDVKKKFIGSNSYINNNYFTFIYKYKKPKEHISCQQFYDYIETQELIELNDDI